MIDRIQFKRDRIGYLDRSRTHLYLFRSTQQRNPPAHVWGLRRFRTRLEPQREVDRLCQQPDGGTDSNSNSDIWVVSPVTREVRPSPDRSRPIPDPIPTRLESRRKVPGSCNHHAPRPDLVRRTQAGQLSLGSGTAEILTADLDRNVSHPRFDPDGKAIYFSGRRRPRVSPGPAGAGEPTSDPACGGQTHGFRLHYEPGGPAGSAEE